MKPSVRIINDARGGIIDEAALADALQGRPDRRGRARRVRERAARPSRRCSDCPPWCVTPHLGASTAEAQDKAGVQVAEQVVLALAGEFVPNAMNVNAQAASETVRPFVALGRAPRRASRRAARRDVADSARGRVPRPARRQRRQPRHAVGDARRARRAHRRAGVVRQRADACAVTAVSTSRNSSSVPPSRPAC